MRNLILIFFFTIYSCQESKESETVNRNEDLSNIESIIQNKYDIIFHENDTIIRFHNIEKSYGVFKWGVEGKFENTSNDTLYFDKTKLSKIKKVDNYFIFTDGCGTACDFALVSKFYPGNKGRMLMYPLLIEFKKGLIIFKGDKDGVLVSIYNLKTGKTKDIFEDYDKTIRPPKNVIEEIIINDKGHLMIDWYINDSERAKKEFALND